MRILHLSDFYTPTIGGLERHVETLSREFVALGHEVDVVTLRVGDRPAHEVRDGVRVHRVRGWSTALAPFYENPERPFHPTVPDPGLVATLRRAVAILRPDVVHSQSWLQYSYSPLYRRGSGPAHVATLHDYGLACAKKTYQFNGGQWCDGPRLAKCVRCATGQYGPAKAAALVTGLRASRPLLHNADAYIAVSSAVARAAGAALPPGMPVSVIPSMVPDGIAEGDTPRPDFLPPGDYLLYVGALGRHKGVDVLLAAHERMRHRRPLVLVGTRHDDDLGLDRPGVTVVHDQPHASVMAAWRSALLGVVPSVWHEPMGQVAVEAMLTGRAVVASDVGGLRDIVDHGVTGLRVPPSDPIALAAALDELVADPTRAATMGAAGRDMAARYQASVVAPRVIDVFEQVIAARRA
ncbi:MAG TPA: glycosyltransferase family 4 protein [Pseudonocardiaceae bacterium]|jgi:glycosyltransferase involved in cell wall biosynthesis|nr:glycosyltransferase family 4 protein [Pseudonocardiaceae bacterium]